VLLAIGGFLLMAVLMIRHFPAAILTGILATTVIAFVAGIAAPPTKWISFPPSWDRLSSISTSQTPELEIFSHRTDHLRDGLRRYHGNADRVSARADFLDEHGNLPEIGRPMLADALSTILLH